MLKESKTNILLWAPVFFGYDKQIKEALVSMGHTVHLVHDRPFKSAFLRAFTTRFPNFISYLLMPYYKAKLGEVSKNLDYILVINGQTLTPSIFDLVISKNSGVKKILYLWDSIENRDNVKRIMTKFDSIFSFDINDCQNYSLDYRPLFYAPIFYNPSKASSSLEKQQKLVVGFIGTIHSDRLKVISRFSQKNPCVYFKKYMYLHQPWVYVVNWLKDKFFRSYRFNEFKYSSLSLVECVDFFSECDAILDIEHANQTGLTMRTLECIGMNKRLVTTNKSVIEHDFYSPNSVCMTERECPVVSDMFLKNEFLGYPDGIRFKYSLNGWIHEVFGFKS